MSACSPVDRLMQTLRVEAPGATDAVIELQLFNTMDEFFRRTSAWQVSQDIELAEGVFDYPFAVPANATVVRVMSVMHNGVPVSSSPVAGSSGGQTMLSLGSLIPEEVFPDGDAEFAPSESDVSGGIFTYAIYRPDYLSVTGTPDAEARQFPLRTLSALSVSRSCLECAGCADWQLEDWMYDMYFNDLLEGTLSRMMGMAAKPWSSTTLAAYHAKKFRNAMALRKQEIIRGFNWDKPMWRYPGTWTR